MKTMHTISNST